MATTPAKAPTDAASALASAPNSPWPAAGRELKAEPGEARKSVGGGQGEPRTAGGSALQALLAFSAMHQQIRWRRALASRANGFETVAWLAEFEPGERFVLDEVLQAVAERATSITGADGLAIALAENNEIVLRASAGVISPAVGARIRRDSAFSGACFRSATIIRCNDTEEDSRVNREACRELGARSMVAVPLCGRRRVIGLLEAFSSEPYGFNDSDVSSLELLAELVVSALKPEEEDRFAESARAAEAELSALPACLEAGAAAIAAPAAIPENPFPEPVPACADFSETFVADDVLEESNASEPAVGNLSPAATLPEGAASPAMAEVAADLDGEESPAPQIATPPAGKLPAPRKGSGMFLVCALIVLCGVAAATVWWNFRNAPLADRWMNLWLSHPRGAAEVAQKPQPPPALPPAASPPTAELKEQAEVAPRPDAPSAADSESNPAADSAVSEPPNSEPAKMARVNGIRHWSASDASTVVLDLQDQVQYEAHRLANPERIYFDLHDTHLAPDIKNKAIDIGDALLARVRVAQPNPGMTRVVLETKGNPTYAVSMETNPYRLVVQLTRQGANPKARVDLFPEAKQAERAAMVVPPPTREDVQLRSHVPKMRIVVDAGHGGWDLGTVGKHGLLEKDVVLEVAQRLGKLLETRLGAEVILTRNDDTYIPLDERAGMANHAQADLFVSVHANYSDLPSARGVETYYTNTFSSPNAKDMETRQPGGKNPGVRLSAAELHERIEQSRRLAGSVQRSLHGTLAVQSPGLRDRGVKEASYVVLTETAMPGILAEVSFVSSPADEQRLSTDGYREQIAEAIYKGIARYAAASGGLKMASASK